MSAIIADVITIFSYNKHFLCVLYISTKTGSRLSLSLYLN